MGRGFVWPKPNEEFDYKAYDADLAARKARAVEHKAYKRELYLKYKARKRAKIDALNLHIADIPADVLAAIEFDCRRYREVRIAAALRRIGEAKLKG